jgi:hypothetical protein
MKRNRTAIILVLLLGGLAFWFIINKSKTTIKETLRDFAVKDTAAITKIFLADKQGRQITLERENAHKWMVNGKYVARPDVIRILLMTIARVDVKEPVSKGAHDNVVKTIATKAVRCEIWSGDKLMKAYYVGGETQDMTGTYMIMLDPETMETSERPFITYIPGFEGYLTTRYLTEEAGWRDRTVFAYTPDQITAVKLETPFNPELGYELKAGANNSYELKMLNDQRKVEGIDPVAVKQYLSYFQQLNFESFEATMKQEQIDSVKKSQPINILTVTDKSGKTNTVKFYARKPKQEGLIDKNGKTIVFDQERMSALLDNGKDFVMVQYFVFGKVMPPAQYFLQNEAPAAASAKKN